MANLNLSEFTEKLFVADADHTFIWDSAVSISKRVSRNSWLNSGTLTSDAPVTISQTWGTLNATYTAAKVNVTETAAASSASNLLDLQLAGNSLIAFKKSGQIHLTGTEYTIGTQSSHIIFGRSVSALASLGTAYGTDDGGFKVAASGFFGISFVAGATNNADVKLYRDGAGTFGVGQLALRNGGNPQTFNVYGTYSTSPSLAYARLAIACDTSGNATLTTQSTGVAGTVSINGISASANGNLLNFAGSNGSILSQNNYINLQSNAYAAVQVTGARGAGNEPSSVAIYYGPPSGVIDATSAFKIYRRTGGVDSVPFMVNSAGNVGIGTTAPAQKLEVWGNSGSTISKVTNVSPGTGSVLWLDGPVGQVVTSTGNLFLTNQSVTNGIVFETNLTEKMRITASGNVGIGTTSPTSKLQVSAGDIEVDTIAKGVILKSPDGTRYRVTVANGGTLSVAAV